MNRQLTIHDQLEKCLKRLNINNEKLSREQIEEAIANINRNKFQPKFISENLDFKQIFLFSICGNLFIILITGWFFT